MYASQDLGCANYEIRHFVSGAYLASIPGGQAYLDNILDPTPPCISLWGTKSDREEIVVGMLKKRLPVTVWVGPRGGWMSLKLQNVLVIDELPVPLHISLKALELYPEGEAQTRGTFRRDNFGIVSAASILDSEKRDFNW